MIAPSGPELIILPRHRAVRGGVRGASLDPQWPAKDPTGTDVYGADFTWVLDGPPQSVTALVVPDAAVTLLEQEIVDTAYVMRITGGVDGVDATIVLTATDANGRVEPRAIVLPIVAQTPSLPASSAPTAPADPIALYSYTQSVPEAVWVVQHNLNRFPAVTVIDDAGDEVEMDVRYVDANTLTLTAAGALSGVAYLS